MPSSIILPPITMKNPSTAPGLAWPGSTDQLCCNARCQRKHEPNQYQNTLLTTPTDGNGIGGGNGGVMAAVAMRWLPNRCCCWCCCWCSLSCHYGRISPLGWRYPGACTDIATKKCPRKTIANFW